MSRSRSLMAYRAAFKKRAPEPGRSFEALAIHLVDQPFQYYGGTLATFPDGPAQPRHGNSRARQPDEQSADDKEKYAIPTFHRRESGGEDRRNPDATAGGVEHFFALVRQVCCERHQRPPRFRFSDRQFNLAGFSECVFLAREIHEAVEPVHDAGRSFPHRTGGPAPKCAQLLALPQQHLDLLLDERRLTRHHAAHFNTCVARDQVQDPVPLRRFWRKGFRMHLRHRAAHMRGLEAHLPADFNHFLVGEHLRGAIAALVLDFGGTPHDQVEILRRNLAARRPGLLVRRLAPGVQALDLRWSCGGRLRSGGFTGCALVRHHIPPLARYRYSKGRLLPEIVRRSARCMPPPNAADFLPCRQRNRPVVGFFARFLAMLAIFWRNLSGINRRRLGEMRSGIAGAASAEAPWRRSSMAHQCRGRSSGTVRR